jgi:hypothetical protein
MMTYKQLQKAVRELPNISAFCAKHKLPLRTVMRVKAGGFPRAGTMVLLEAALNADAKP